MNNINEQEAQESAKDDYQKLLEAVEFLKRRGIIPNNFDYHEHVLVRCVVHQSKDDLDRPIKIFRLIDEIGESPKNPANFAN